MDLLTHTISTTYDDIFFDIQCGAKSIHITPNDISIFKVTSNRCKNDSNNKKREAIIFAMLTNKVPSIWFDVYSEWDNINSKLWTKIDTIQPYLFDSLSVTYKGGRGNYEYLLKWVNEDNVVLKQCKLEFKHNSSNITKCPQFLSVASKNFTTINYAEFFYDNYIPHISTLYSIDPPPKDLYLKCIHSDNYRRHPFFHHIHDTENDDQYVKDKKKTHVYQSIHKFIDSIHINKLLDFVELNKKLKKTQDNKIFLLWDLKNFHLDTFSDEELNVTMIKCLKQGKRGNNTSLILETSHPTTEIHMLLRWKNRLGILYPAWQISLHR